MLFCHQHSTIIHKGICRHHKRKNASSCPLIILEIIRLLDCFCCEMSIKKMKIVEYPFEHIIRVVKIKVIIIHQTLFIVVYEYSPIKGDRFWSGFLGVKNLSCLKSLFCLLFISGFAWKMIGVGDNVCIIYFLRPGRRHLTDLIDYCFDFGGCSHRSGGLLRFLSSCGDDRESSHGLLHGYRCNLAYWSTCRSSLWTSWEHLDLFYYIGGKVRWMDNHLTALAEDFSIFRNPFACRKKLWNFLRIMWDSWEILHGFMCDDICGVIIDAVFCSRFVVKMGWYDFLDLLCGLWNTYARRFLLSRMKL